MNKEKSVVCMTTFNRVDCSRINQEIIKLNYKNSLPIVHACSNSNYEQYLEDFLIFRKPLTLQHGALDLLKSSIKIAIEMYSPKYIIHLEGDTWIMNEEVIFNLIKKMDSTEELVFCSSAWDEDLLEFQYLKNKNPKTKLERLFAKLARSLGYSYKLACTDSLATQFFIMKTDPKVIDCFMTLEPIPELDLEQALYRSFLKRFGTKNILRLKEREPIHPHNRYVTEELTLYSQHWPARGTANDTRETTHPRYISPNFEGKKETLQRFPYIRNGFYIKKLLESSSYDYYNPGASRT